MDNEKNKLLSENLGIIKRICSDISFIYIDSADCETNLLSVDEEKDPPGFQAGTENNRVSLHSSRRPREESQRQIKQWIENSKPQMNGLIVVLGFAGMHHIEALLEFVDDNGTVVVIDIIPEIFKKALLYCDIKKLLEKAKKSVNIAFIVTDNLERLKREFRHYLKGRKSLDVSVFAHPGLQRTFPDRYGNLASEIENETRLELMDRSTKIILGDQWVQHALKNLPFVLTSPPIDALKDRFKGKTAIVAAAGPSLIASMPYIKEAKDKCAIFCVGTALKPLLNAGLEPDFVVSLDSDPVTLKQFEGIPETKTTLLASLVAFTEALKIFKDRVLFFSASVLPRYQNWLKSFGALPETIASGGTVSLTAIDLARFAGFSRVIFTGLDLAVQKDGTTHASGTMYGNHKLEEKEIKTAPGNYEKTVNTTNQFASYIKMLGSYMEDAMRENDIKFYNATDGGAALRNAELVRPWQIPELVPEKSLDDKKSIVESLLDKNDKINIANALSEIDLTINELNELSKASESAIKTCDMANENINYSELSAKLDSLDSEIKKNQRALLLTDGAMQGMYWEIQNSTETDGMEKSKKFYAHLKGASEWVSSLLDDAKKICKDNLNKKL